MTSKFIFLDIDGTLVDYNGAMPESCKEALKLARKNGHKLIISTGRFIGQIYPWLINEFEFDGFISSSGANVRYGGKQIYTKFFSKEQLKYLDKCYKQVGAYSYCHTEDALVTNQSDLDGITNYLIGNNIPKAARESFLYKMKIADQTLIDNAEKSIYYGSHLNCTQMRKLLGDEYNIDAFSFQGLSDRCGEVNLAEVNKGTGLIALVTYVGGSVNDTIAFGDGENDASIIKQAGIGVAMANGDDAVKSAADMITTSVSEDGIYNGFKKLGLI